MSLSSDAALVDRDELYRRITWRVVPLLLLCYTFAYLDRVNIGFAKLAMQDDLSISDSAYGLAAGIFFLGYVMFEIPSNLLLTRIGARATFTRILLLWGLASAATAFVQGPTSLMVLRFLLGVFEAGFAPGMIFYLGLWFPARRMAAVMGVVMLAGPIGSMLGGPVSSWIIAAWDGLGGLHGWQWMFLLEGLPCILLAAVVWRSLVDRPELAPWLSAADKRAVADDLTVAPEVGGTSLREALTSPRTYVLAVAYFCLISGIYAMSFWLPTILTDNGIEDIVHVGLLTAVPYALTIVVMIVVGRRSDRTGERMWHSAVPAAVAAVSLTVAAYTNAVFALSFAAIALGTAAVWASYTVFWSIPSSIVHGTAAAGAIAMINSIGLLGGFVSPTLIGVVRDGTGSTQAGLLVMVALLAVAVILLLVARPPRAVLVDEPRASA